MAPKVRIKDIAEKSGVSVGTVDRILHNRPNVSKAAREKVEKVLKEINYQPNVYASALAYNKSYSFHIIMPRHDRETYWEEIEEGAMRACDANATPAIPFSAATATLTAMPAYATRRTFPTMSVSFDMPNIIPHSAPDDGFPAPDFPG